ncbi:MAG: hypothetical protein EBZ69_08720, partial [Alphaproteobacteria bacterium]|nr:hypothetical protein [Alphaproteobacteria bacterium]
FCNLAALKKGRAAPVVAMIYSQLPTGAVLGYFLYQQTPKPETLMGAVIIILAGLYLIWHESRPRPISDNISTP